jgi:1-acyl-sn-glycerol-3-phosphate acyltransferase
MFRRVLVAVLRLALRVFFRRVEVAGRRRVPREGAVIFVVNHPNALVDPAFVLCHAPRRVSFLAKEPIFRMPVIGTLARAIEAIPVYRKQDEGSDTSRNRETFRLAGALLRRGGTLAICPEGVSHSDTKLRPLKTGAARIALGVAGGEPRVGLKIVPAGLYYTAKTSFRSSALLYFGEPIVVEPVELTPEGEPPRDAVQALSSRVERALREVTLNAEHEQALQLIARAERIFSAESAEAAEPPRQTSPQQSPQSPQSAQSLQSAQSTQSTQSSQSAQSAQSVQSPLSSLSSQSSVTSQPPSSQSSATSPSSSLPSAQSLSPTPTSSQSASPSLQSTQSQSPATPARPLRRTLARELALRQRFLDGYAFHFERNPERLAALEARVRRYEEQLRQAGVDPEDLSAPRATPAALAGHVVRRVLPALCLLPIAAAGALVHYPTYKLTGLLARRLSRESDDVVSTIKIVASMLLFPATWIALAVVLFKLAGWPGLVAGLAVAPLAGLVAVRLFEELDALVGGARALRFYLTRRWFFKELLVERRRLYEEIVALGEEAARTAARAVGAGPTTQGTI